MTPSRSEVVENALNGVLVLGDGLARIDGATAARNGGSGIRFVEQARGSVRASTCRSNTKDGVSVAGEAAPELQANDCLENQEAGIAFYDDAGGHARENLCRSIPTAASTSRTGSP